MAGPAQPLDLNGSLAVLQALLNAAAGVPGETAQYEQGSFVFPQVGGDGVALLPDGSPGTNELTRLSYDIISIVGIGNDEQRNDYHPEILPADDTYVAPGETIPTLGSIVTKACGNRTIRLQVKAETHAPSAAGAWLYIERIRTRLALPTFGDTLEDAGFAIANYTDARPTRYKDASGRTVSVVYLELEINAADTQSDDPITTIEDVTPAIVLQEID
jgi:hypothetical protein